MRLYKLKIYFKDTPHPWIFDKVCNFNVEGAFLRIIRNDTKKSEWFPTENIFRIIELDSKEA